MMDAVIVVENLTAQEVVSNAMPKKTIEVDDPPAAFLVSQEHYDELLNAESTKDRESIADGKAVLHFKGIPVFRKDRVVEVK